MRDWMLQRIAERDRRDWSTLPLDFERDAVRATWQDLRRHWPRKPISERIKASKATTFAELRQCVEAIHA